MITPMTTRQDDLIRKLVSVADARAMLGGIGRTKLYELLARGNLSAVKLGRRTLLVEAEVAAFAARLPQGAFRGMPAQGRARNSNTADRSPETAGAVEAHVNVLKSDPLSEAQLHSAAPPARARSPPLEQY